MIDFGFGVKFGPIEKSKLDTLRSYRNDPKIYSWCRQFSLISDQQQESWFVRQDQDPSIQMYCIYNIMGDLVGCAGLTSIDRHNQRAEFSIYIAPAFHNIGLGKKALKTLLSHGFKDQNLNLIWGECFSGNMANNVFESVGLKKEGIRREFYFKGGKFIDANLISMTKKEWEFICSSW